MIIYHISTEQSLLKNCSFPMKQFKNRQKLIENSKNCAFHSKSPLSLAKRQADIIFVMAYLNNDYSLNYSIQHQESTESQTEFLKIKLIETHSKFIKELQYSKDLEEKLSQYQKKHEHILTQNQELRRRCKDTSHIQHHQRKLQDQIQQLQLALVDSQKKNDLLRSDLQIMRGKTAELASLNQQLQQQNGQYERSHHKINDKLNSITKQTKMKQIALDQYKQEADRYRAKYEKQVANNQEAQKEIHDLKREREELIKNYQDIEANYRAEKEKQSKQFHQILTLQKQAKQWKNKSQNAFEQIKKTKDQLYQLRARTKTEQRNLTSQLQRLTLDYNNLQSQLKQKDIELSSARKEIPKKKHTFDQTRQLIGKLQRQEQRHVVSRASPTKRPEVSPIRGDVSPLRTRQNMTYKQQKQEYLSIIQNVGTMESQMLACNMEKKKILSQIDKIDQTRVKTKDMISKRRRLDVELQNNQRKLDKIRNQLKKMKVM